MVELNLDASQAQILRSADDGVLMRDPTGVVVGTGHRLAWSPEQIEELEQRLDSEGPWHSTVEVLSRLQSLEVQ